HEQALAVEAPALQRAAVDGAGRIVARRDRRRGHARHRAGHVASRGRAVAELAGGIAAPARHRAAADDRARVGFAGGGRGDTADVDRDRLLARDFRAVAELAVVVRAPALHATGDQRTRVVRAGHDGGRAGEVGDLHRNRAVDRGVVAELAVVVAAPAPDG